MISRYYVRRTNQTNVSRDYERLLKWLQNQTTPNIKSLLISHCLSGWYPGWHNSLLMPANAASTNHPPSTDSMPGQRRRRWPGMESVLGRWFCVCETCFLGPNYVLDLSASQTAPFSFRRLFIPFPDAWMTSAVYTKTLFYADLIVSKRPRYRSIILSKWDKCLVLSLVRTGYSVVVDTIYFLRCSPIRVSLDVDYFTWANYQNNHKPLLLR